MRFFLELCYLSLLRLLGMFFFWLPAYKVRKSFENKNDLEPLCISFKRENLVADLCFEFSSEGEYQQVASLIDDALIFGKKVELIFFSPSVEKTIIELAQKFPEQIRYLRYPLLKGSFRRWITSKRLILVRYDLFPDFLAWARNPDHKLVMVWVSFKKERIKKKSISWLKKLFIKNSELVFFASDLDVEVGRSLGVIGPTYDFRIEQIRRRILKRDGVLKTRLPLYPELKREIDKYPREKRLIFGNVWPSDLFLLKKVPSDFIVVILPHKLSADVLDAFKSELPELVEIDQHSVALRPSRFYLLNIKGILCEFYTDFGKAYVGGGFETSVHSLLEPLVAESEHIAAGPINHRSTEFDMAKFIGHTTEVKNAESFEAWLELHVTQGKTSEALRPFLSRYDEYRKEIILC